MSFYLLRDGEQAGPFTLTQLQGMWSNGSITSQTLYWQEGMAEWVALGPLVEETVQRQRVAPPPKATETWSDWQFLVLVILSLLIPLIGFLIGLLALANPLKRQRGLFLICVGIISIFAAVALIGGLG